MSETENNSSINHLDMTIKKTKKEKIRINNLPYTHKQWHSDTSELKTSISTETT